MQDAWERPSSSAGQGEDARGPARGGSTYSRWSNAYRTSPAPRSPSQHCTNAICVAAHRGHTHTFADCGFPGGGQGDSPCSNPICRHRGRQGTHVLAVCLEEGGHAWARKHGLPLQHYTGLEVHSTEKAKPNRYCTNPVCVATKRHRHHTLEFCRETVSAPEHAEAEGAGGEGEGGASGGGNSGTSGERRVRFSERVLVRHAPASAPALGAAGAGSSAAPASAGGSAGSSAPLAAALPPRAAAPLASAPSAAAAEPSASAAASAPSASSAPTPSTPERPAAMASHLTSLSSVLQIVFSMHGQLTASQLRKQISGFMPRLAAQLGSEEAFVADLKALPGVACLPGAGAGGEDCFRAR